MHKGLRWTFRLLAGLTMAVGAWGTAHAENTSQVSFREDIMPILQVRCVECHRTGGDGVKESGLNLENYQGLMKGTKYGPVVVPGNAMVSNLNVLVEGKAAIRMPHNRKPLTKCEVQSLKDWVNQGAKDN